MIWLEKGIALFVPVFYANCSSRLLYNGPLLVLSDFFLDVTPSYLQIIGLFTDFSKENAV